MTKFKGSTFQVGDVVEISRFSASVGLLDFVEGKSYFVEMVEECKDWDCLKVYVADESGRKHWYHPSHFKLKENTMESNENHFKVGQTVWDVVYGKGVVTDVNSAYQNYPIHVKFPDGTRSYTADGKLDKEFARTLFFSEPKIIAETKPAFVPTLQVGTPIILTKFDVISQMIPAWVTKETEDSVIVATTDIVNKVFYKTEWNIYSVGEKIEFN